MRQAVPAAGTSAEVREERGMQAPPHLRERGCRRWTGVAAADDAFPPSRRCCRKAKAIWHSRAWWCRPRQPRPSKWSRPSSSFICWCICSRTQRALIVAARIRSGASAGWLVRWYLRSPAARSSQTSHAASPGRCWARAATGPSATRTRTAAKRAFSGPLVPRRQERGRNARRGMAAKSFAASTDAQGRGHRVPGRTPGRPARPWRERHVTWEDLLGGADAERPGQPPLRQTVAELRRLAVFGVPQHAAEARPGGQHTADLVERDPPLGLAGHRLGHPGAAAVLLPPK